MVGACEYTLERPQQQQHFLVQGGRVKMVMLQLPFSLEAGTFVGGLGLGVVNQCCDRNAPPQFIADKHNFMAVMMLLSIVLTGFCSISSSLWQL